MSKETAKSLFNAPIGQPGPWLTADVFRKLIDQIYEDMAALQGTPVAFEEVKMSGIQMTDLIEMIQSSKSLPDLKRKLRGDETSLFADQEAKTEVLPTDTLD